MLTFGYWMASNLQLLSNNNLYPRADTDDVAASGHTVRTIIEN